MLISCACELQTTKDCCFAPVFSFQFQPHVMGSRKSSSVQICSCSSFTGIGCCFYSVVKIIELSQTSFIAARSSWSDNVHSKAMVGSYLFFGEQFSSLFFMPLWPKSPLPNCKSLIFTGATFSLIGSQEQGLDVQDGLFNPILTADPMMKNAAATWLHVCDMPAIQEQCAFIILPVSFAKQTQSLWGTSDIVWDGLQVVFKKHNLLSSQTAW